MPVTTATSHAEVGDVVAVVDDPVRERHDDIGGGRRPVGPHRGDATASVERYVTPGVEVEALRPDPHPGAVLGVGQRVELQLEQHDLAVDTVALIAARCAAADERPRGDRRRRGGRHHRRERRTPSDANSRSSVGITSVVVLAPNPDSIWATAVSIVVCSVRFAGATRLTATRVVARFWSAARRVASSPSVLPSGAVRAWPTRWRSTSTTPTLT